MKRVLYFLCALFYFLVVAAQDGLVRLDESRAITSCLASSPCNFLSSNIWVGDIAPTTGDDVTMAITGSTKIYVRLENSVSLNNLFVNGPLIFTIDTSFDIHINGFYVGNSSQVTVADANIIVDTATFTNEAILQLSGNANFSVTNFTEIGGEVLLLDTSILRADYVEIDTINATVNSSFEAENVSLLMGEIMFSCPVNISLLATSGYPSFNGGYLGEVYVVSGDIYTRGNVTVANLTVGPNALFFGSGNILFQGPIAGVGSLFFEDAVVVIGQDEVQTDLRSMNIRLSGITTAYFYNVEFGEISTPPSGNVPPLVTLNLYGASFSVSASIMCTIYSTDLTFSGIEMNITGTVNSMGGFAVMNGGYLNVSQLYLSDGSASIFAPTSAELILMNNCTLDISAPLYGTTNMSSSTVWSHTPIYVYGDLIIVSSGFTTTVDIEINVSGDISCYGYPILSGNFSANSFTLYDGVLMLQGSISAGTAEFKSSAVSIQNQTTINCHFVSLDTSSLSVFATLTIIGNFLLHSYELYSSNNQTIAVNGSIYSTGNSTVSSAVNIIADTFTHVGGNVYIQGIITARTIGFANADVFFGPTVLHGNTSMAASIIGVHSPLLIQGSLLLRANLQAPIPQTITVTDAIIAGDNTFIYSDIHIFSPYYLQSAGTLHLNGLLSVTTIVIAKGAILATKSPTTIRGNIHVQGGLLEFHQSTNVTGSIWLDAVSQTMLYNTQPTSYPVVQVDGDLNIEGSLVYWISPAPKVGVAVSYKVFSYTGKLNGRFSSYDSYAPNIQMVKFNLKYSDKQITLIYKPAKSLGIGAQVGIGIGAVVVAVIALGAALFFYRRYRKRQKYTSIERVEEEINKYLLSNTPTQQVCM